MSQPAVAALAPLPFELVYDDGRPLDSHWHAQQLSCIREAIRQAMADRGRTDFYTGTNMFVYYSLEQAREVAHEVEEGLEQRAFRGPDVFWVEGVGSHMRKAWVSWEEGGRLPDLILELLSPSTAKTDRTVKKDLYAQVFRTREYFLVDPDTRSMEGFDLVDRAYQPKTPDAHGRVWSHQLGAAFGFWDGSWLGTETFWVRLFRADGTVIPTEFERSAQQVDAVRRRAEAAEAELARLRARLEESGSR